MHNRGRETSGQGVALLSSNERHDVRRQEIMEMDVLVKRHVHTSGREVNIYNSL